MLIGYMRASKAKGAGALDQQRDALLAAGVDPVRLYEDHACGRHAGRPGLEACLTSLRPGDTLVVWTLDRLGRDLRHLVNLVDELTERGVGLRVLAGKGAAINTATPNGQLMLGAFAVLAEFERALLVERGMAGLAVARARGRLGGRSYKMTAAKLRFAQVAMGRRDPGVSALCAELGITRQTLYRHVDPEGRLRPDGERLLCHLGAEREPGTRVAPEDAGARGRHV